eukprot:COSAG02_NODE_144_length_34086_cov_65.390944_4_plen_146_part_00
MPMDALPSSVDVYAWAVAALLVYCALRHAPGRSPSALRALPSPASHRLPTSDLHMLVCVCCCMALGSVCMPIRVQPCCVQACKRACMLAWFEFGRWSMPSMVHSGLDRARLHAVTLTLTRHGSHSPFSRIPRHRQTQPAAAAAIH